jgi:acyl-homoserine-lactone acylase
LTNLIYFLITGIKKIRKDAHMKTQLHHNSKLYLYLIITGSLVLTGCKEPTPAFDQDGVLKADITRTEFGTPHIVAENLESVAFGAGYAFAQDNMCLLADQIVKYNSQRSRYFGPDKQPESGDSYNLINDFSFKALEIRAQAESGLQTMSENVRAMLSGYAKGYNHYVQTTPATQQDPRCAGKPWMQPIDEVDLLTYILGITLLASSAQFLAPIFVASPPDESYAPQLALSTELDTSYSIDVLDIAQVRIPKDNSMELGSNGWALGKEKSEKQMGMLLANPHFPHTGNLRFWQFHTTIPGHMDVMGASLAGMPGIVNIGFNRNVAWTHTYSTAQHFIVYRLTLDDADLSGMSYIVDGESKPIERKTLSVDIKVGDDTQPFKKDIFYSEYGPMIVVQDQLPWGQDESGDFVAFCIKDANKNNFDLLEFWMATNLANNMEEFKQAFMDFDGVTFNNTMAADRVGNTFYIDDSTVPYLSEKAETALTTDPTLITLREQAGFAILPGDSSVFDFNQAIPYQLVPKLERTDFVQNSNDSYWLTNPASPLTGYSTLYGEAVREQTLRSRMGQQLLQVATGDDQRFSLDELEHQVLLSNRNYLGEAVLTDLLKLCANQGNAPIVIDGKEQHLTLGCQALAQWDGLMNLDSRGAHLFREFAEAFSRTPQWVNEFDPNDPLNTPNTLANHQRVLAHLAKAIQNIETAGISLDAPLGEVQFFEQSHIDGTPTGEKLPWAGANNIEGGFNVFRENLNNDGTLLPRHVYPPLPDTQLSAEAAGYHVSYGSSWMMIMEYTPKGPNARGLVSYSQATNPNSPYIIDQTRYYSEQTNLRPIWFDWQDIRKHEQNRTQIKLDTR